MFNQNKITIPIMVLGQGSYHGLAVVKKTRLTDHPSGLAWRNLDMMIKKNKPRDTCTEIELNAELKKVWFNLAVDYYNNVVTVMARFDVDSSN